MPFINCGCCGGEIFVSLRGKDAEISYSELISNGYKNCDQQEDVRCSICDAEFTEQYKLENHIKIVHSGGH